jgi:hypothetical protein
MSEPDAEIKSQIAASLEDFGFEVVLLEEREGVKTPDLLATKNRERFLFEIKSKGDDEGELAFQRSRAAAGEVGEWSEPWSPRNTISGVIREGVQQLAAFPSDEYDYSLLWLHAEGIDPESQFQQFSHTLFGLARVFTLRDRNFDYKCYFFHESAFFRLRNALDAAIISTPKEAQLCLNTYSPRVNALRQSTLARALEGGICDPETLERKGLAIVADCGADRRNSSEVIRFLQEKYGAELLQHMHMGRLAAWVDFDALSEEPAGPPTPEGETPNTRPQADG